MLRKLDLETIAKANPAVTIDQMEDWEKLRAHVAEVRRQKHIQPRIFPFREQRARIVDDLDSDPRVVTLHRP